jgi:hypothetical protein
MLSRPENYRVLPTADTTVIALECPKVRTMPPPNSRSEAASRRVLSFTGKCEYRFLDLCLGEICDLFQVNMREIGQFVG